MSSSKPIQITEKSDQETLRDLSNLDPENCLDKIAHELQNRLHCETVCILLWYEVSKKEGDVEAGALITRYHAGLPSGLRRGLRQKDDLGTDGPKKDSEIYYFGEGITGGYIFKDLNSIRARIQFSPNKWVFDDEAGREVQLHSTNWHNMDRFRTESKYKDFKSLLGLPLIVKNQTIGVVKLINKLNEQGDGLDDAGFTHDDLERVKTFLSTIELVIETKANEKEIQRLFEISQKLISADFNYDSLLQQIATSCAKALNLRLCIIRLLDHQQLRIKASSLDSSEAAHFDNFEIPARVIETSSAIKLTGDTFQTIDGPRICWTAKIPDVWTKSSYGIKSFLAVPVVYQDKVIGVIECYAFLPRDFSSQQVADVRAYGTLIATLFQRNKIKDTVSSLIGSFSLLTSLEQIHDKLIELIENYLDTKTVSIWEKKPVSEGFVFELINASKGFHEKYKRKDIHTLTENSMTARVANAGTIKHFTQAELDAEKPEHREFLTENNLSSLTIVPITIGGHVNAVLDVFYDEDKSLLREEEDFFQLLTRRAASAIWNKKLTLSLKVIADELLSSPNVESILRRIAYMARSVLYADLVILFPYNSRLSEFMQPQMSGKPIFERGIYIGEHKKEKDFVNLMLDEPTPLYLEGTQAYRKFCENKGEVRPWRPDDFWHREKLSSMAAVRLDDGRRAPVGVMFFNYRSPFHFDDSTKQAIESFASQAASALVSGTFKGLRTQELLGEIMFVELLEPLIVSIDLFGIRIDEIIERLRISESLSENEVSQLRDYLEDIRKLHDIVDKRREHHSFDSDFGNHNIDELIENVLAVFDNRFHESGIAPKCDYEPSLSLYCGSLQIQGMLHQLISILLDASASRGSLLRILTNSTEVRDTIRVKMLLTGGRVSDEDLQGILNQPLATSRNDVFPEPGRFESCKILAQSHRGNVKIQTTPDGLLCTLDLGMN